MMGIKKDINQSSQNKKDEEKLKQKIIKSPSNQRINFELNTQILTFYQISPATLKQTQIEVKIQQNSSSKSIKQNEKKTNKKQLHYENTKIRQTHSSKQQKLNDQQAQIIEHNSDLNQNLFIGSHPGLFYSKKSSFQNKQSQSIQKLVSIQNLSKIQLLKEVSNEYFQQCQHIEAHQNHQQQKISQKQKLSENSGDTLYDETTQTQQNIERDTKKWLQTKMFDKNKIKPFCLATSKNKDKHSKYCKIKQKHSNQKQFVIPVLIDKNRHNKSKYKKNQYSPLRDSHLTNFFATKNKQNYVQKVYQNKLFNKNHPDTQNASDVQIQKKFMRSMDFKTFSPVNRISTFTNPHLKAKPFQFYDFEKQCNFDGAKITNTKFLIKEAPSQKTRRFFNQSISTLINHNYRPMTCLKRVQKQNHYPSTHRSRFSNIKVKNTQQKIILSQNQQQDCDYWAQINSFKGMNLNSKKGRKIKMQKSQNKIIEPNTKQQAIRVKSNQMNIQFPNNSNFLQKNQHVCGNSMQPLKQIVYYNSQNKQFQDNFSAFSKSNKQLIKEQHLKRISKLQKQVMSKIGIVNEMGVKMNFISKAQHKNHQTLR